MYKYLLCWRYLKTRYIALASVVSVMLGVATMIVVNSVMAGFADKMRDRLHGVLADVVVESLHARRLLQLGRGHGAGQAGRRRRGDRPGPDHGNARHPPLPLPRRQVITRPVPDHRHQPRGAGQDRRFRRVPGRRPEPADPPLVRGPRQVQAADPGRRAPERASAGRQRSDRPE